MSDVLDLVRAACPDVPIVDDEVLARVRSELVGDGGTTVAARFVPADTPPAIDDSAAIASAVAAGPAVAAAIAPAVAAEELLALLVPGQRRLRSAWRAIAVAAAVLAALGSLVVVRQLRHTGVDGNGNGNGPDGGSSSRGTAESNRGTGSTSPAATGLEAPHAAASDELAGRVFSIVDSAIGSATGPIGGQIWIGRDTIAYGTRCSSAARSLSLHDGVADAGPPISWTWPEALGETDCMGIDIGSLDAFIASRPTALMRDVSLRLEHGTDFVEALAVGRGSPDDPPVGSYGVTPTTELDNLGLEWYSVERVATTPATGSIDRRFDHLFLHVGRSGPRTQLTVLDHGCVVAAGPMETLLASTRARLVPSSSSAQTCSPTERSDDIRTLSDLLGRGWAGVVTSPDHVTLTRSDAVVEVIARSSGDVGSGAVDAESDTTAAGATRALADTDLAGRTFLTERLTMGGRIVSIDYDQPSLSFSQRDGGLWLDAGACLHGPVVLDGATLTATLASSPTACAASLLQVDGSLLQLFDTPVTVMLTGGVLTLRTDHESLLASEAPAAGTGPASDASPAAVPSLAGTSWIYTPDLTNPPVGTTQWPVLASALDVLTFDAARWSFAPCAGTGGLAVKSIDGSVDLEPMPSVLDASVRAACATSTPVQVDWLVRTMANGGPVTVDGNHLTFTTFDRMLRFDLIHADDGTGPTPVLGTTWQLTSPSVRSIPLGGSPPTLQFADDGSWGLGPCVYAGGRAVTRPDASIELRVDATRAPTPPAGGCVGFGSDTATADQVRQFAAALAAASSTARLADSRLVVTAADGTVLEFTRT